MVGYRPLTLYQQKIKGNLVQILILVFCPPKNGGINDCFVTSQFKTLTDIPVPDDAQAATHHVSMEP